MNIPTMYLGEDSSELDKEIYQTYLKIMEDIEKSRNGPLRIFNKYGYEIPESEWERLGFVVKDKLNE